MNFKKPRNSAPLVPIRPPPPPPGQAAPPSGRQNNGAPSKKGVMNLSKLIPKRMQKNQSSGSSSNHHETITKKSAPPPRPPPPKFATKQPVLIDLLSGSPPSSPSPTLRSQESGFEESPDVWKSWPESSASTPMVDWTVGPAATADPWDAGWSSSSGGTTSNAGWATFDGAESQRQLSEVRSTTMPTLNSAAATLSAVKSTPSMPTIIRPGGPKKLVKKDKVDDIFEDDQSPPMPSFPPPQLPQDVEDTCNEPTVFHVVAVFDYESDHPEDLSFKAGEVIEVLSMVNEDWYTGQCGDRLGHFPSNFVEPQ